MLLLALQTATNNNNDRLDGITLILVVLFILSMATLSFLLNRRSNTNHDPPALTQAQTPESSERSRTPPVVPVTDISRSATTTPPVWLEGVDFAATDATFSDAVRIIETLLTARRSHELMQGLQFYTPEYLRSFQTTYGIDNANLEELLTRVEYTGIPPALCSVELIDATGNRMKIRAGYTSNVQETYYLVYIENRWLIDRIESSRW